MSTTAKRAGAASLPRFDRPLAPLVLYRGSAADPPAVGTWTADLDAARRSGPTWSVQVGPERLLAYSQERREWLVDARGLVITSLERGSGDKRSVARDSAAADLGALERGAELRAGQTAEAGRPNPNRTPPSTHRGRLEAEAP